MIPKILIHPLILIRLFLPPFFYCLYPITFVIHFQPLPTLQPGASDTTAMPGQTNPTPITGPGPLALPQIAATPHIVQVPPLPSYVLYSNISAMSRVLAKAISNRAQPLNLCQQPYKTL